MPGTEGQFDHYFALGLESASMTIETSTAVTTINGVLEGNVDPADLGLDTELPAIDVNVDAGPFPGLNGPNEGQVGGGAWYITNTGPDEVQAGAWDFVKYVNQPENQALWHTEGSYLPVRQETVESDARSPTSGPTPGPASGCRRPTRVSSRSIPTGPAR